MLIDASVGGGQLGVVIEVPDEISANAEIGRGLIALSASAHPRRGMSRSKAAW
jgi:hypothetical protein